MDKKILPKREYLDECFTYDAESGLLLWRERPLNHFSNREERDKFNMDHAGRFKQTFLDEGYFSVYVDRCPYMAHRIIWKLTTGEEPNVIDHINGVRHDNRMSNLRSVTQRENSRNVFPYHKDMDEVSGEPLERVVATRIEREYVQEFKEHIKENYPTMSVSERIRYLIREDLEEWRKEECNV